MKTDRMKKKKKNIGKCSANKMRNCHRLQTDEEWSGLSARNIWRKKKHRAIDKIYTQRPVAFFGITHSHLHIYLASSIAPDRCGQLLCKPLSVPPFATTIRWAGYSPVECKMNVVHKKKMETFGSLGDLLCGRRQGKTLHKCCREGTRVIYYAHFQRSNR